MSQSETVKWYKAELHSNPVMTYLVAASSYEAVKKSFGCLLERYKISLMDYDGMTLFFNGKVIVTGVKTNTGGADIMFIKDDEICALRIIL